MKIFVCTHFTLWYFIFYFFLEVERVWRACVQTWLHSVPGLVIWTGTHGVLLICPLKIKKRGKIIHMLVCWWNGSSVCRLKRIFFFFLRLKTLLCPLLFTLHSWTRGIQPEGKLLLQIKIRLWWIFGQYWRPLKVPFNEGKTCWQLISPVFSYFYLSDSSGRVCWTSLLLEISLLWSHKRCWHQLPQVGDNNPSEVFVLTVETDALAASLFISLFFGPFSNLDSTRP